MAPENGQLEKEIPIGKPSFLVSYFSFRECNYQCMGLAYQCLGLAYQCLGLASWLSFCISFKRLRCNGSWKRKAGANPMLKRRSVVGGWGLDHGFCRYTLRRLQFCITYCCHLLPYIQGRNMTIYIYMYVYFWGLHWEGSWAPGSTYISLFADSYVRGQVGSHGVFCFVPHVFGWKMTCRHVTGLSHMVV